jgi:hypothetical protein
MEPSSIPGPFSYKKAPPATTGRPLICSEVSLSLLEKFKDAGQRNGLGAKTTRSACATPRSNTFWRFPLKLPLSVTLSG